MIANSKYLCDITVRLLHPSLCLTAPPIVVHRRVQAWRRCAKLAAGSRFFSLTHSKLNKVKIGRSPSYFDFTTRDQGTSVDFSTRNDVEAWNICRARSCYCVIPLDRRDHPTYDAGIACIRAWKIWVSRKSCYGNRRGEARYYDTLLGLPFKERVVVAV